MLPLSLSQLAKHLRLEFRGDGEYLIKGLKPLDSATPLFLSFANPSVAPEIVESSQAGVLLASRSTSQSFSGNILFSDNPYLSYAQASQYFETRQKPALKVSPSASIADDAIISACAYVGPNVTIGSGVVVGENTEIHSGVCLGDGTVIGSNCTIFPNVVIYHQVQLGNNVRIHSGTVIGADGFGFAPSKEGWVKIHQLGAVRIADNVEIGANVTIDRGAIDDTVIERNVILDNMVHVAHNVRIGEGTAIAGCSAIAGSSQIGKNCLIAGKVAIAGHLKIADNTQLHACTLVTKDIRESGTYASAPPLQEVSIWRRNSARYTQLSSWVDKIKSLQKAIKK